MLVIKRLTPREGLRISRTQFRGISDLKGAIDQVNTNFREFGSVGLSVH